MTRPLRSVLIGDVDFYPSEYAFGVNQAMTRAGHWHTSVNIRQDVGTIAKRVREVQPDVIWGHMLLWAPGQQGGTKTVDLLCLCEAWRAKRGTKVLLHDGDARIETRFPTDISAAVDLALCNHTADRSVWKIPQLHWPYFCFYQAAIATPVDEFRCDLAFAGRLDPRGIYAERTAFVLAVKDRLGARMKIFPGGDQHTLFRTPELAASAHAVLGFARPDRPGWIDVRVFQYPGAGAILLHDDAGSFLTPGLHYLAYDRLSVDDVLKQVEALSRPHPVLVPALRQSAFEYTQRHHSATARVRQALAAVGLTL